MVDKSGQALGSESPEAPNLGASVQLNNRTSSSLAADTAFGDSEEVAGTQNSDLDSDEEDELSNSSSSQLSSSPAKVVKRNASLKRKGSRADFGPQSPKRSRPAAVATVSAPSNSLQSASLASNLLPDPSPKHHNNVEDTPADRGNRSSSYSPRDSRSSSSVTGSLADRSAAILTSEEVRKYLTLISKHHPENMSAQSMKNSVDALHHDWRIYCESREVPTMDKKALMDEYGKIFAGVYGPRHQKRAKEIAQELSQRDLTSSSRRIVASREGSETGSEVDDSDMSAGGSADESGPKEDEPPPIRGSAASTSKKSSIARVGRNGLAVLPPGLFDVLRTHLREEIMSSIMPLVRNELTEQTRESFLQHQDLFNRMKDMEEQIRNQDLWIRHLLARDAAEWQPHGPSAAASVNIVPNPTSRSIGASSKESSISRVSRFGQPSEYDYLPPRSAQSGGDGVSPRQQRFEQRPSYQQGFAGPNAWDSRSAGGSGPVRWEGFAHDEQDQLMSRRASYAVDPSYRADAWADDYGSRPARVKAERPDFVDNFQRRDSRPVSTADRSSTTMGGPTGVVVPSGSLTGNTHQRPLQSRPISPQDTFRRPSLPAQPYITAEGGQAMYDSRRPYQHFSASFSDPHFAVGSEASASTLPGQTNRSPLPPRGGAQTSEAVVRNKRGRPTNAEASTRINLLSSTLSKPA